MVSRTQELLVTMTTAGASVSFHVKSEAFRVNCKGGGETGSQSTNHTEPELAPI
jgi:hypothetical protein